LLGYLHKDSDLTTIYLYHWTAVAGLLNVENSLIRLHRKGQD